MEQKERGKGKIYQNKGDTKRRKYFIILLMLFLVFLFFLKLNFDFVF